jgi:hypothetical protein
MPEIYGIEFDETGYDSIERCLTWLRGQPQIVSITENKSFRLKKQKSPFMSVEPRRVWQWFGQIWRVSELKIERPDPHIVIYVRTGGHFFEKNEVPTPSDRYLKQLQIQEHKQRDKEMKRRLKNEEQRNLRKLVKSLKGDSKKERTPEEKASAKKRKLDNLQKSSKTKRVKIVEIGSDELPDESQIMKKEAQAPESPLFANDPFSSVPPIEAASLMSSAALSECLENANVK